MYVEQDLTQNVLSLLEGQWLYVYSFLIKGHVEKQETEIGFTLLHKKFCF